MRVIGGEFRSRRLKALPGLSTRPTPDRLRETLFNILAARVPDSVFLDAYAGSGAVGIEALSRGAAEAIFIERSRAAADIIRENLTALSVAGRAQVIVGKTLSTLARFSPDVAFLDPPYELEQEYSEALRLLGEHPPQLVIAQHSVRLELGGRYGELRRFRTVRQGDNALSFYAPDSNTADPD